MADCFEVRRALGGMSSSLQPLIDRTLSIASGGFLVLYSGTRDAKASNWLFDLCVLLLRLVGFRSVAV